MRSYKLVIAAVLSSTIGGVSASSTDFPIIETAQASVISPPPTYVDPLPALPAKPEMSFTYRDIWHLHQYAVTNVEPVVQNLTPLRTDVPTAKEITHVINNLGSDFGLSQKSSFGPRTFSPELQDQSMMLMDASMNAVERMNILSSLSFILPEHRMTVVTITKQLLFDKLPLHSLHDLYTHRAQPVSASASLLPGLLVMGVDPSIT